MISNTQVQNLSDLTILLPTLNEEASIRKVLDEIEELPFPCQVLVIDGLSRNGTLEIAQSKGASVLLEHRRGKGIAVRSALGLVRTPYIIMVDADYTYPMRYIGEIYELLREESYDVVVGYRQLKERGSMSLTNAFGNFILSSLASVLFGHRIYDVCSGMWGFRRETLDRFHLTSKGFTLEADLFTNSIKSNCRMFQIPVGYRGRLEGGKAKLKLSDGFRIAWFLIKRRIIWLRVKEIESCAY